jgi:hypothetical protein
MKDPHHAAAVKRGNAAVGKLQQQGIIDSQAAGLGRISPPTCRKVRIATSAVDDPQNDSGPPVLRGAANQLYIPFAASVLPTSTPTIGPPN